MNIVQVVNVSKKYRLGNEDVDALKNVSVNIEEGVFIAIAGPSGSGKSTLLNMIGCIDSPSSGRIIVNGHDISGKTPDELSGLRARTVGFIFQTFNLLPVLSAEENVEYPLLQFPELTKKDRRRRVDMFLDVVNLRKYGKHRPNEMSGGQRQRVAIARALATNSKIVLADEPTANLDSATGESILELMRNINRSSGTTFIFSTHDRRVMTMADRLVRIEDGVITSLGQRGSSKWVMVNEKRASAEAGKVAMASIDDEVEKRADIEAPLDVDSGHEGHGSSAMGDEEPAAAPAPSISDPALMARHAAAVEAINREIAERLEAAKAAAKQHAADTVAAAMVQTTRENSAKVAAERVALAGSEATALEVAAKIAALEEQLLTAARARRLQLTEASIKQAVQSIAAAKEALEKERAQRLLQLNSAPSHG
jgi:putative ABC transport system ATP-binding protein